MTPYPLHIWMQPNRPPDEIIGPPENPYMNRWFLQKDDDCGRIYLHQILRSDDDRMLHDHPADSYSIGLCGRLQELSASPDMLMRAEEPLRFMIPHDRWHYRRATQAHRLILEEGEAWTLFCTGPVYRAWGFWYGTHWVDADYLLHGMEYGQMPLDWEEKCKRYIAEHYPDLPQAPGVFIPPIPDAPKE